jgi:predicted ATPase/DNA-binding XRE family transcriptional regulator/Tfp pilus assembly protein PilF
MEYDVPFGTWLRQRRKALDVTQWELAEQIGCTGSTIQKIEEGKRRPSRQMAGLLADYLEVPPEERETFVLWARLGPEGDRPISTSVSSPPPATATLPPRTTHVSGESVRQPPPTNLPAPLTPLIGRETEVVGLREYLSRHEVRLLTLTGAPGIGKTRLSIEAAAESSPCFAGGVYFAGLAGISNPDLVLPAIAQALEVQRSGDEELSVAIRRRIGDKGALIVLDNFEQVLDATPRILELLAACSTLKVMVTSREALHVHGEWRFVVPPLELPDLRGSHGLDPDVLSGVASVALFTQRAVAVKPDFALTSHNAEVVAAICTWLDGLPLAIELAAARIAHLTPGEILSLLDNRLALLRFGSRHLPARQRTLRGAIDWSYDLLEEGERALLRRLAVFAGGCALDAARKVCERDGAQPLEVIEGLSSLLDKSLLQQREGEEGEPRYEMLGMVREYALERLRESGEEGETRRLHAEYFTALAEATESELEGPQQARLMERLENEHDNLQAALDWAIAGGNAGLALQLSGSLAQFWSARGYLSEGRRWLEMALSVPRSGPPEAPGREGDTPHRARAFVGAGLLAARQGDYVRALALYEQGLAIYRALGDKRGMARALVRLGAAANEQGDFDKADLYYRESLDLFRATDDKVSIAGILNNLGNQEILRGNVEQAAALYSESLQMARELGNKLKITVALLNLGRLFLYRRADFEQAEAYLEEALTVYRELGSKGGIAATLYQLGQAMLFQGNYARAQAYYVESLALCEQLGERPGIAATRLALGFTALRQANYEKAQALLSENLTLYRELNMKFGVMENLEGLAGLAAMDGNAHVAARLFGIAEVIREGSGMQISPVHTALLAPWVEQVSARLGPDVFASEWAAGRAMSVDEAVEYAYRVNTVAR